MKTLLFFYLNSLVLTHARQSYLGPFTKDCKLTSAGREYAGQKSVTRSGLTCQRWNSDQPHYSYFKTPTLFPEGSAEAAGNRCRNPDTSNNDGVWCYTTHPNTIWEFCDVEFCNVGCKMTMTGHEYAGPLSVTRSGLTCQRWDSDQPHTNGYKDPKLYPDGSLAAAGNKCRNPDKNNGGVWCYTNDPNTVWEYCNLDFCECKLTNDGREYAGSLSVTRSGLACQRWDSDHPHHHDFRDSKLYPEGSASAAGNRCRNPDKNEHGGVWCYTTDPNKRWEFCNVDFCGVDCKMTMAGHEYAGPLSVTRSGRTCQRWDSDHPHHHDFRDSTLYPEGGATAAGNKCRNPDTNEHGGVWCYTTDPGKRWEFCDVDYCGLDCKMTMAGHEYAGPLSVTRSGRTCQRWDSDYPHGNHFKNSTLYPEGGASAAGNKCRNPDINHNEGVWCYTTDTTIRWEPCDVVLCDFTAPVFPSSTQTPTSTQRTTPSSRSTMGTPSTTSALTTPGAIPTTTTIRMTIPPETAPQTTRRSTSTEFVTEPIRLSSPPSTKTVNSRENASTNIVVIIAPSVGVIAVICVVVVIILALRRNPSSPERNLQLAVTVDAKPKQDDTSV